MRRFGKGTGKRTEEDKKTERELFDMVISIGVIGLVAIAIFFMLAFSTMHISGEIHGKGKFDANHLGVPLEMEELDIKFEADIPLLALWQWKDAILEGVPG